MNDDKLQLELDQAVARMYEALDRVANVLYRKRDHSLHLDPQVAYLVGALKATQWKREKLDGPT
jgi:hypothetical protein